MKDDLILPDKTSSDIEFKRGRGRLGKMIKVRTSSTTNLLSIARYMINSFKDFKRVVII
jgi:hypothetical protein